MRLTWFIAVVLAVFPVCCPAAPPDAPEKFPALTVGANLFTNVTVTSHNATHLTFKHARGIATVRLEDLSPELQKHFGYDPTAARQDNAAVTPPALPAAPDTDSSALTNARPWGTVLVKYPLGTNTLLCLFKPETWKDTFVPSPMGSAPAVAIRFERTFDQSFQFVISTIPEDSPLKKMSGHDVLEMTGSRALPKAYEKALTFEDVTGPQARGGYFTLTDRGLMGVSEPKPGQYKYQTQGFATIQSNSLSFGMLYNFPNTGDFRSALVMITNAFIIENTNNLPPATNGFMAQEN